MVLLADRVQETTTTTGTGTLVLGGATTGCRTFNAAFTNGTTVYYTIDDGVGNWEVGSGVIGTGTLTRSTVLSSSNAGGLVTFAAGTKIVWCDAPAAAFTTAAITGGAIDGAIIGGVTPAAITGTDIIATSGMYAKTTFGGTYADGIVVDYSTGNGRISVGTADTITFYTGGVANTAVGLIPTMAMGGIIPMENWVRLTSTYTLTSQTAAQKLFNASTNGAVTLPIGTYNFECGFALTSMSGTSGSFGFALVAGGGAVIGTQGWFALADKAAAATASTGQITWNTAANTTLVTGNTTTTGQAYIKGTFTLTTGGTITPSVSLGVASAAIVAIGSFFRCSPVSSSATATTVGNWS